MVIIRSAVDVSDDASFDADDALSALIKNPPPAVSPPKSAPAVTTKPTGATDAVETVILFGFLLFLFQFIISFPLCCAVRRMTVAVTGTIQTLILRLTKRYSGLSIEWICASTLPLSKHC